MRKPAATTRDTYYAGAESWANDRQEALRSSRRIAWIVAGAAMLVAVCEALALLFLAPLKTVVPLTLMVDRQTGFVQRLNPLDPQNVSADDALLQSFLVQYVIAREGYAADTADYDIYRVQQWSSAPVETEYLAQRPVGLPRSTVLNVQVKSATHLPNSNVYLVRFQTVRQSAGGREGVPGNWVAAIRYTRSNAPLAVNQRWINPLGFQVVSYRRNAETLPAPEPTPAVAVPAAGPAAPPGGTAPNPLTGYPRTLPTPVPFR